jgi:zinc D-Ala-D-Ala carboxypeptidase
VILRNDDARGHWQWEPEFRPEEFACHHCGELVIETEFMHRLADLRRAFDRPMLITSGYRCPEHNVAVSSTGPKGPHTTGRVVDVGIYGPDAFDLVVLAPQHGMTGIGVNQKGDFSKRFVHLDDIRGSLQHPRPRVWSY